MGHRTSAPGRLRFQSHEEPAAFNPIPGFPQTAGPSAPSGTGHVPTWPLGQGQLGAVTRRDLSAPAGQAAPQRCSGTSTWPCLWATLRAAHTQPAVRVFSPARSLCQRAADTAKLRKKEASASAHSASSHSTCRHAGSLGGSLGGSHQPAPSCASCTPLSKPENGPASTLLPGLRPAAPGQLRGEMADCRSGAGQARMGLGQPGPPTARRPPGTRCHIQKTREPQKTLLWPKMEQSELQ